MHEEEFSKQAVRGAFLRNASTRRTGPKRCGDARDSKHSTFHGGLEA